MHILIDILLALAALYIVLCILAAVFGFSVLKKVFKELDK